ncbi:uroporphyrinogen-III synthase [Brachybacterium sp. YJGR34]|uniref:uroporphyrinogen-III synthase n=1 Tax=Brachybacterium sp. YJGR34 TaxID=2059911 RepID=UPI000E0C721F|nr:uroporphyrinogen-III synthase [Brachybacterium sp. YJGR34]
MTAPHPVAPRPVLVTRPAGREDELVDRLLELGLEAESHPLVRLVPADGADLDAARDRLVGGGFTELVITSRTAVAALATDGALQVPRGTRVVAVGPGTAAALAAAGVRADLVAGGSGQALVDAMPEAAEGANVLFPASASAARTVPEGLRAKGYTVHEVIAYRSRPVDLPAAAAVALARGGYGAIVLTSPLIAQRAAAHGVHPSTAVVTIGDPTSRAAREAGLRPAGQAEAPTDAALARAVQQVLTGTASPSPSPR